MRRRTLKTTSNAATYLVLTPSALRDGANALAAYRGGKVVELRDIYDEFSYGIANPHAIQDFLAYAAKNWKTKPKFVALLGKGSFDPKDYLGGHTNLFPMLMTPTPDGLYRCRQPLRRLQRRRRARRGHRPDSGTDQLRRDAIPRQGAGLREQPRGGRPTRPWCWPTIRTTAGNFTARQSGGGGGAGGQGVRAHAGLSGES